MQEILRPLAKEMARALPKVSPTALKKLETYAWPGNVRELRNVLERALITLSRDEIRSEDLALEPPAMPVASSSSGEPTQEWEIRPLDDVIASYVAAAVKATDGNVRKAARKLQISPSTLYARMKK